MPKSKTRKNHKQKSSHRGMMRTHSKVKQQKQMEEFISQIKQETMKKLEENKLNNKSEEE